MTMKNGNTITALRERIARGELSHEALIDEVLAAAEQPAAQHVFTRLYADAARAAARHADAARKAGVETAPLAGLPVSVKDLYDVAGETTMAGSAVSAGVGAGPGAAPMSPSSNARNGLDRSSARMRRDSAAAASTAGSPGPSVMSMSIPASARSNRHPASAQRRSASA